MGWDFTRGADKKDVIADVTAERNGWELVAKRTVGNHLWVVWNPPGEDRTPFIMLYLLSSERGFGWGYKDMDESMHPYYYTCPEKLLELAPEACPEGREGVRAYHERRKRKVELGATYALPGCRPDRITITCTKPLLGEANGRTYRVTKTRLGDKLEDAPELKPLTACS